MSYDGPALPALLGVMRAAGLHDLSGVEAGCEAALTALGRGHHKARPDVLAAREAARAGRWRGCWGRAHQATCGLTHAFPPDPGTCPPVPDDTAPLPATVCGCGVALGEGARFCHVCGAPRPGEVPSV